MTRSYIQSTYIQSRFQGSQDTFGGCSIDRKPVVGYTEGMLGQGSIQYLFSWVFGLSIASATSVSQRYFRSTGYSIASSFSVRASLYSVLHKSFPSYCTLVATTLWRELTKHLEFGNKEPDTRAVSRACHCDHNCCDAETMLFISTPSVSVAI
jgi:hypothetical protein